MRIAILVAFSLLSIVARAQAANAPLPEDIAMVKSCMDLVAANDAARPPHVADELTEEIGPAGRLAGAAMLSASDLTSCIGVVANKCVQDSGGTGDDSSEIGCSLREAAVWQQRLDSAYKTVRAGMEHDAAAHLEKVEHAWTMWRDLACRQPYVTYQGSMAGPMEAWCEMNLTARQAVWMEEWKE